MIFSGELCRQVQDGHKTQTRRPFNTGDEAEISQSSAGTRSSQFTDGQEVLAVYRGGRTKWRVQREYAIQPGRSKPACGHFFLASLSYVAQAGNISHEDARAEGFPSPDAFRKAWVEMYGAQGLSAPCWRLAWSPDAVVSLEATIDFRDHEKAVAFFNQAFQYPERQFTVTPTDTDVARQWLHENAWAVNAGQPMQRGGIFSINKLYERNRCGWAVEDHRCAHPIRPHEATVRCDSTGQRLCHPWQCPIADEATYRDIRHYDEDLWAQCAPADQPDNAPSGEYVILHTRPRYAYVPNVRVIGCEGETQL